MFAHTVYGIMIGHVYVLTVVETLQSTVHSSRYSAMQQVRVRDTSVLITDCVWVSGHGRLCDGCLRQKVSRCFWPWVSAGSPWLDSWYATQSRNVLVITCSSRFTSLTRNMTSLIVGSAKEGLCQTLWALMDSLVSPPRARCLLQPQGFSA